MMWRKAWWECRFRVGLTAFIGLSLIAAGASTLSDPTAGGKHPEAVYTLLAQLLAGIVVPIVTLMMAGSGVNSQTSWGMLHGFHASMYFLLSMPVSRRRALLIRAAVGAGATVAFIVVMMLALGYAGHWRGLPIQPGQVMASIMFLMLGSYMWFGFSTFLSTLYDEFWGGIIGLTLTGFVFGLGIALESKKPSLLSYMAGVYFNKTGDVVWPGILALLLIGTAFMAASVYVVERKEY